MSFELRPEFLLGVFRPIFTNFCEFFTIFGSIFSQFSAENTHIFWIDFHIRGQADLEILSQTKTGVSFLKQAGVCFEAEIGRIDLCHSK